ncbi:MAG TPA: protein kinase [Pirellulales bacterium]|jgi:WD40 repeat protein
MKSLDPDPNLGDDAGEESLARLVSEYHAQLLNGGSTSVLDERVADLPAGLQARFTQSKRTLHRLARASGARVLPLGTDEGREFADLQAALMRLAAGTLPAESSADTPDRASDVSGRFAATPPEPATDTAANGDAPELRRLGRFQIVRELGRGGLGVVFLALDPVLHRQVALKVPRPEVLVTPEIRVRFEREAHAAARLAHPHLVPVYEVGHAGPILYMVSAYCAGLNLAQWLRKRGRPLTPPQAAGLVATLAEAVDYAHSQGVLHRDIKPGNILMEPRIENGFAASERDGKNVTDLAVTPKLVDFGMARLEGTDSGETRTGIAMGTPGYMSPEQAEGRTRDIGPATDVHGLGAVLYELLTGRGPFAGTSEADTLRRVLTDEPLRPRRMDARIPLDLEAIALKCLEKNPAARYRSAGALAVDLRRFLAGRPTVARPLSSFSRTVRWARRKPAWAALIGISAIAASIIASGSALHSVRLAEALEKSEEQRVAANTNRDLAEQNRQAMAREQDANAQFLYAARIKQASQMFEHGNVEQIERLLGEYDDGKPYAALRGFEWHYLKRVLSEGQKTLRGHRGEVYGVAFSPDSRLLVSGGEDGTIRLWDSQTGQEIRVIQAHQSCTNDLEFSPDGQLLVSVGCDNCVKLWNTATWTEIGTLTKREKPVMCVAFSPDGKRIAFGEEGNSACVWDLVRRELVAEFAPGEGCNAVAWSPDGRLFAAGSANARIWDTETWTIVDTLHHAPSLAFSPDSQFLIAAQHGSGNATLYDITTRRSQSIVVSAEALRKVAFTHDGNALLGAGADRLIYEVPISIANNDGDAIRADQVSESLRAMRGHAAWIQDLAIAPDGDLIASASFDGTVRTWHLQAPRAKPILRIAGQFRAESKFTANCERLATATTPDRVDVWNLDDGELIRSVPLPGSSNRFTTFGVSPNAPRVIGNDETNSLLLIDGRTPAMPQAISHGEFSIVSMTDDGLNAAVICGEGTVHIWNFGTPRTELIVSLSGFVHVRDSRLFFSNDGTQLALFTSDPGIVDVRTGQHRSLPFARNARGADFSNDGSLIAHMDWGGVISVFDVRSGKLLREMQLSTPLSSAIDFAPDGRTLATGTQFGDITLWHVATGQEMVTFSPQKGAVGNVRFSEDGKILAAVVLQYPPTNPANEASVYRWAIK